MTRPILKNKTYLYLTEFFSGMAVMAVELGASRLLAPYFSSSQIVWTIIIGTIMIAMAAGNWWGGRSADANPDPDRLYKRLLVAALWIAAIPVLGKYVIVLLTGALILTIDTHFLTLAAFLACMVIFVFPLLLLGTVTPSLAKFAMDNLGDAGKTVGMLGAYNTIGSILGTFLPTFLTIPAVGTSVTFLLFSGILLALALVYFASRPVENGDTDHNQKRAMLSVALFVACSLLGHCDSFAFWEKDLLYEGESVYNYLQVKDQGNRRILMTNVLFGVQSMWVKDGGLTGMYYDYALAAPVLAGAAENSAQQSKALAQGAVDEVASMAIGAETRTSAVAERPLDILVLGMGTGTFAKQCSTYFPRAHISGVEIDPAIIGLSRSHFALPAEIPVAAYDGRAYLAADKRQYDVIMVDAYQDITIPFYMSSVEFFELLRAHLRPGGVMVVNENMHSDGERSINAYLNDTIASVFARVATVDVPHTTNRELFAMAGDAGAVSGDDEGTGVGAVAAGSSQTTASVLSQNVPLKDMLAQRLPAVQDVELRQLLTTVQANLTPYRRGNRLLTDDKAPVELLGMDAIDGLIQDGLRDAKRILRERGVEGLLREL